MEKYLNSQDFYELLYSYRTAPTTNQDLVVTRFENIKSTILKKHKTAFPKIGIFKWIKNVFKHFFTLVVLALFLTSCNCDDVQEPCETCADNEAYQIAGWKEKKQINIALGNDLLGAEFSPAGNYLFASSGAPEFEYKRYPLTENFEIQTIEPNDQVIEQFDQYAVWNITGEYNYRKDPNETHWTRYVCDDPFNLDEIIEEDEFFNGNPDDFIHVIPSGFKYYGIDRNTIYEYTSIAPEQFTIDVATNTETTDFNTIVPSDGRDLKGLKFSADGTRAFVYKSTTLNTNEAVIYQIDLSVPFTISTGVYNGVNIVFKTIGELINFQFDEDGKSFYTIEGKTNQVIRKFC